MDGWIYFPAHFYPGTQGTLHGDYQGLRGQISTFQLQIPPKLTQYIWYLVSALHHYNLSQFCVRQIVPAPPLAYMPYRYSRRELQNHLGSINHRYFPFSVAQQAGDQIETPMQLLLPTYRDLLHFQLQHSCLQGQLGTSVLLLLPLCYFHRNSGKQAVVREIMEITQ